MSSMMNFLKVAVLLLVVFAHVTVGEEDVNSDWLDPDDMLNFDPASKTMIKNKKFQSKPPVHKAPVESETKTKETQDKVAKQCPKCDESPCPAVPKCKPEKECVCEQASLPLLRNYVKTLLKNFDDQTPTGTRHSEYVMRITLSADQILILNRFVEKSSATHVHDVHEILTSMVDTVMTSNLGAMEKFALLLENKIGLSLHRLIQFFMLIALASIVLLIEIRLQIPWRRRVGQLIVLMFIISIPWTWYELYKQAEVEHQTKSLKKIPTECQENASNYWKTLLSYVSLQKDVCAEYYEHIMIDPIVKVPPTKAIAVTFVRFFMAPLKDIGTAFSEFIRALLVDLPLTYFPVAVVMVSVFFFLFLFMMFGYSIRLPFFLTIEKTQPQAVTDSQVHQAIGDGNQQILTQLQDITDRMKSNETKFTNRIEDLKQVQQMAIEYNASSTSLYESPSLSKESSSGNFKAKSRDNTMDTKDNQSSDSVDGTRKKTVECKTARKVLVEDCSDDDDDNDDDDGGGVGGARNVPVVDTLGAGSFSAGNVDVVKS